MSTLNRAFVAAIATALTLLPFAAGAADEKQPADQTQKSAPAATKKVTPHSHSEANKQGAPVAAPDQPAPAKKEQGHKHTDWK